MSSLAIGVATTVCTAAALSCYVYSTQVYNGAKAVVRWMATQAFYVGFKRLDPNEANRRRQDLIKDFQAEAFECTNKEGVKIDALYIQATQSPTGNVLIPCLNTTYQDHHPDQWKTFWMNGADILLWSATQANPITYSEDLSAILRALREKNPTQAIALKTYCASSDPGISAAAEYENVHLIIDRGHGDVQALASSFTICARSSLAQRVLKDHFDCQGKTKIQNVRGSMLFLSPAGVDQVMDCRTSNLTRELHALRSDQTMVRLQQEDHWENWTEATYREVLNFLEGVAIVSSKVINTAKLPKSNTPDCFKKNWVKPLSKAWF
jgi:hypothetical protein